MNECPWCGAQAIDVTTHDDDFDLRAAYMCAGAETHHWREGDGPAPVEEEQEPLIILARG